MPPMEVSKINAELHDMHQKLEMSKQSAKRLSNEKNQLLSNLDKVTAEKCKLQTQVHWTSINSKKVARQSEELKRREIWMLKQELLNQNKDDVWEQSMCNCLCGKCCLKQCIHRCGRH